MPAGFSDVILPDYHFLAEIENILKASECRYESLDGTTGFKIRQRDYFNLWVMWEKNDVALIFLGKMMYDPPPNTLEALFHNINKVNSRILEGKFLVIHDHLAFLFGIDVKDVFITRTAIFNWINLPINMLDTYAEDLFGPDFAAYSENFGRGSILT